MSNIVFLPGTLCTNTVFAKQINALEQAGHQCIKIDYQHSGTTAEMASKVLEATQNLNTFSVCAFSMGAMAAFELMRQCPERLDKVALIAANSHADKPAGVSTRNQHLAYAQEHGLTALINRYFSESYLHKPSDTTMNMIADMAEHIGLEQYQSQLQILATRPDSLDTLANFRGCVSIIGGEHDPLCPPSEQQKMHQVAQNSSLTLIEQASHFVMLEQAHAVTTSLSQFFGVPCNDA